MTGLDALFLIMIIAIGFEIWEIGRYIESVHVSLLGRLDKLDKSIAELKELTDQ